MPIDSIKVDITTGNAPERCSVSRIHNMLTYEPMYHFVKMSVRVPTSDALTVARVRTEAARLERQISHQWSLKKQSTLGGAMMTNLLASSNSDNWSEWKMFEEAQKFWSIHSFWSRSLPTMEVKTLWRNEPSEAAIMVAMVRTAAAMEERLQAIRWRMMTKQTKKDKVVKKTVASSSTPVAVTPNKKDNNNVKCPTTTTTSRPSHSNTPLTRPIKLSRTRRLLSIYV
ncbi:hypothetical protein Pmani_012293 [Petrolisthes manimaculis]|uniref:Uncharacterized protein n=1 Tax=Petrolisthes manimaculis TaxID=1843537 RepID=A0AAE1PXJ8_9EUCA|nr:hypothetical protein Pmani_012293 [Petrolisthes manimaculis]